MLDNKTSILPSSCVKKNSSCNLINMDWIMTILYWYCFYIILSHLLYSFCFKYHGQKYHQTRVYQSCKYQLRINVFASLGTLRRCCLITLLPLYSPTTLFFASTRFWYLLSSIAIDTSSPAYTRNRHVTRPSPSNKPLITVSATESSRLLHPVALVKFQRWPKARWHQLILHWKARTYCQLQLKQHLAQPQRARGHYFSTLPTNILVHIFWTRPGSHVDPHASNSGDPNENFPDRSPSSITNPSMDERFSRVTPIQSLHNSSLGPNSSPTDVPPSIIQGSLLLKTFQTYQNQGHFTAILRQVQRQI